MIKYSDSMLLSTEDGTKLVKITTATLRNALAKRSDPYDAIVMANDGIILIKEVNNDKSELEVFKDDGRVIVLINSHDDVVMFRRRIVTALTGFFLHLQETQTDKHISNSDLEIIMDRVTSAYSYISMYIHDISPRKGVLTVDKTGSFH